MVRFLVRSIRKLSPLLSPLVLSFFFCHLRFDLSSSVNTYFLETFSRTVKRCAIFFILFSPSPLWCLSSAIAPVIGFDDSGRLPTLLTLTSSPYFNPQSSPLHTFLPLRRKIAGCRCFCFVGNTSEPSESANFYGFV